MQTLAVNIDNEYCLKDAMSSLENFLNENNPDYLLNALKYYKSHKKLDEETFFRIKDLFIGL